MKPKRKNLLKLFPGMLKQAGKEFVDDHGTKLSASLAYITIFSIGPLFMVMITVIGMIYKNGTLTPALFDQISSIIGKNQTQQVEDIIKNLSTNSNSTMFNVFGGAVLAFGATGIFSEIQSSINYIWSIKSKPKKGWLKYITDRLLSFSLIIGCGFLFLVSLLLNLVVDVMENFVSKILGESNVFLVKLANFGVLFSIVTFMFAVIYKVLPDALIKWKDALAGAAFTAILFLIGKFLIGYYLGSSSKFNAFGAASSLIILLTWVYYSSIILYFGAEFTKVYANTYGRGIKIKKTAVYIVKREAREVLPHEELNDEG